MASELKHSSQTAAPTCSTITSTPRFAVKRLTSPEIDLPAVIDDFVGAEGPCLLQFPIRSGSGNHARAHCLRDLDGCAAHAGAGANDQHILTRPELGAGEQHVPGGEKNQRHRGSFVKTQIAGDGYDIRPRAPSPDSAYPPSTKTPRTV